jgi:uncharacterized protein DUF3365
MPRISLTAFATIVIAAGLQPAAQPASATWPTYTVAAAPPEWRHTISHGDLIVAAVNASLGNELGRDLPSGVLIALTSCHIDTIAVETGIARGEGVIVGRTSARLRNADNRAPAWAAPIVARHATGRASEIDGFVVDLGDRIGLLRPIAHRPICDPCHGRAERIDPAVLAELRRRYPGDRGVGFRSGDLRGWYWVELLKR